MENYQQLNLSEGALGRGQSRQGRDFLDIYFHLVKHAIKEEDLT